MAKVAIGLAVVISLGGAAMTVALAHTETRPPLHLMPTLTASTLAWGAGMLLAFASAAHALRKDRDDGVRALLAARGAALHRYVWARVAGLATLLAAVVGGGTLLAGGVAILSAHGGKLALASAQATIASLVYSIAFAATMAPVALAALGARSRAGGYVWLSALLFVPEIFSGWIAELLPETWGDLVSVPGALASLRGALMPHEVDVAQFARAFLVLAIVTVLAILCVWKQLSRVDTERATR